MLSGCTTSAPVQQTRPLIVETGAACPLTPCHLPARSPIESNDDWPAAVDDLEDALLTCAIQVRGCIDRQNSGKESEQDQGAGQ
ncbi:Rz1-like lysis system protein LysC [Kushneria pakistanensis]|uniref:Rz1-like lysis system protein LysC n=1 Tax=Kushneria pakistanensis TaxID=1508770 RepID=UPI003570A55E